MRSLSTRAAGLLILILGVWGGLAPFVGPYFHFALGPNHSWTWTSGRFWLSVLPGVVAVIGGLLLLGAGPRPSGKLGALLALAAGIWFAIGPEVSLLWNASGAQGAAHGSKGVRVLEMLTYHTLLGAVMTALAGYALPGLARRRVAAAEAEPAVAGGRERAVAAERDPAVVSERERDSAGLTDERERDSAELTERDSPSRPSASPSRRPSPSRASSPPVSAVPARRRERRPP